jgi:hypothetical protein
LRGALHEAMGEPVAVAGPAPVVLSWPLPGCRPDSLTDLFSPRALAELARVGGAEGGAVVLELGGHTLQAPAGGRPGSLHLLEGDVPPAGLHSLALRNGTLALRPGMGVAFASTQPFAVSLERVKLVRPAPIGGSGAGSMVVLANNNTAMVTFHGTVSGRMVHCRVELSPAGPAGSGLQVAVGVGVLEGAHVVLEDVDVVGCQGAGRSSAIACGARGARIELHRCARGLIVGRCVCGGGGGGGGKAPPGPGPKTQRI